MAAEPLTNETVALTEKKVDMALDDIIKMSKGDTNKGKKQWRASNKSQKFNSAKENALKVRWYMESSSALRQGAFARRRSNFQGNQFPVTANVARKAAAATAAPIRSRHFNASGVAYTNKSRVGAPPLQTRTTYGGFTQKVIQQRENKEPQANAAPIRQRPGTLDSLFANMKEQRLKTYSQQKSKVQLNRGSDRPRVPWARGRFHTRSYFVIEGRH